jgi:hypothetical protein
MRTSLFKSIGGSLAALTIGVSVVTTPAIAGFRSSGGGGFHGRFGGGGFHGGFGGGGFHSGFGGGGFRDGFRDRGFRGGFGGYYAGYGYCGYGYGYYGYGNCFAY